MSSSFHTLLAGIHDHKKKRKSHVIAQSDWERLKVAKAEFIVDCELAGYGKLASRIEAKWARMRRAHQQDSDSPQNGHGFEIHDSHTELLYLVRAIDDRVGRIDRVTERIADESEDFPPHTLTANDEAVLRTMVDYPGDRLMSIRDIRNAMEPGERLSDRTVRTVLNRLIENSLAERPEGSRSGARLTLAGRRRARQIT
jgi:hypothetical protein